MLVEKAESSTLPELKQQKYLIPETRTLGHFLQAIRERLSLDSDDTVLLSVDEQVLCDASMLMSRVFQKHKDEDGFLYFTYHGDQTLREEREREGKSRDEPQSSQDSSAMTDVATSQSASTTLIGGTVFEDWFVMDEQSPILAFANLTESEFNTICCERDMLLTNARTMPASLSDSPWCSVSVPEVC